MGMPSFKKIRNEWLGIRDWGAIKDIILNMCQGIGEGLQTFWSGIGTMLGALWNGIVAFFFAKIGMVGR